MSDPLLAAQDKLGTARDLVEAASMAASVLTREYANAMGAVLDVALREIKEAELLIAAARDAEGGDDV
jgi:hypothetical protein